MWLRGLSLKEITHAIQIKQKETGLIESFPSYYSGIYGGYFFKESNIHKIYPVTIKIW